MDLDVPATIGVLLPFAAIVLGIGIGMLAIYLDFRKKREMFQLYHNERMTAIDRGIELPPIPWEMFSSSRSGEPPFRRRRRLGLILLFVGAGVSLALKAMVGELWWWGLVPVALGLAYLVSAFLDARDYVRIPRGSPPVVDDQ